MLGMGVYIGKSTKIYKPGYWRSQLWARFPLSRCRGQPAVSRRQVQLYCAVIVKQVDAQTRSKTSINELLRGD